MDRNKSILYDRKVLKTFKIILSGRKKKVTIKAFSRKEALLKVIVQYVARGWTVSKNINRVSPNCSSIRIVKKRVWNTVKRHQVLTLTAKYLPAKTKKDLEVPGI